MSRLAASALLSAALACGCSTSAEGEGPPVEASPSEAPQEGSESADESADESQGKAAQGKAPKDKAPKGKAPQGKAPKGKALPSFTLADPSGEEHSSRELAAKGLILVVTTPTMDQGDAQKAWSKALGESRPSGSEVRLVFLQDMSQSWFEDTVRERLREEHEADEGSTLLLLDEEGEVRAKLGVPEDATQVLVYGPQGELRTQVESSPAEAGAPEELWREAQGSQ